MSLYADDSTTWKSGPNVATLTKDIQRYLDLFTDFFKRWGFKLSVAKTVAIVFTRCRHFRSDDVKLTIDGSLVKGDKTVRFLGVVIDRAMTWSAHVDDSDYAVKIKIVPDHPTDGVDTRRLLAEPLHCLCRWTHGAVRRQG